jgi:hypothetical protein
MGGGVSFRSGIGGMAALAVFATLGTSCAKETERSHLDAHAATFRETRRLRDLQALLPALELGLPRARVEQILGKADYCPTEHQCYYASDSRNAVGVPYGLVVDYQVLSTRQDQETPPPGRLESLSLMAIGE